MTTKPKRALVIPALWQSALDPTMRGRVIQVYVHLCFRLDPVEYRSIKFAAESRTLGMQRANLSHVIHHLIKRGYLDAVKDTEDRRRQRYRLMYSVGGDLLTIPPPGPYSR